LQCCNKMAWFVTYVLVLCFLQGVGVNGIANAALTSIEKQFKLSSAKSALIPSAGDIGALCVVLFVSFIGSRYHKPRLIAAGSVVMAIGSLLFMVPHFAEEYAYAESSAESSSSNLCNGSASSSEDVSSTCETGDSKYLSVFVIAQAVHGIGFSPMFTLGTVYIDENEAHNLASLYIGSLTYAAAGLGVATGFFIGGQFIGKLFVDFDRKSVDFNSSDPRWVGAWWFGFIITSIGFLLVAIPISCFPKSLPSKLSSGSSLTNFNLNMLATLIIFFFQKLRNPVYMTQVLGGVCGVLNLSGSATFSFKYLAEQYNLSPDIAGAYIGGLILFGAFGMFLGGFLVRIFNLSLVGMLRLSSLTMIMSAVLGLSYLAGCPEVPLVGMEIPYDGRRKVKTYQHCKGKKGKGRVYSLVRLSLPTITSLANPVQSSAFSTPLGVYKQSCRLGANAFHSHNKLVSCARYPVYSWVERVQHSGSYGNCSCVAGGINTTRTILSSSAVSGKCQYDCTNLYVWAPCLFLANIILLTSVTPSSMATLRCVEKEDKALAVGISWMFLRLLGSIPGPVLVGLVLDQSCLLWSSSTCMSASFCQLYSHKDMAITVMTFWIVVCTLGAMFFFMSSCFAMKYKTYLRPKRGTDSKSDNKSNK
ncbi:hypothetical protein FSP39_005930, partial [Pinctada imbricata]